MEVPGRRHHTMCKWNYAKGMALSNVQRVLYEEHPESGTIYWAVVLGNRQSPFAVSNEYMKYKSCL